MLASFEDVDDEAEGGFASTRYKYVNDDVCYFIQKDINYMLSMDHDFDFVPLFPLLWHDLEMRNTLQWNVDDDKPRNSDYNRYSLTFDKNHQDPILVAKREEIFRINQ